MRKRKGKNEALGKKKEKRVSDAGKAAKGRVQNKKTWDT